MKTDDATYMSWGAVEQYLDHANDIGLDVEGACANAGIIASLTDPEAIIPGKAFERFFLDLIAQSGSPLFGLETSKYIKTKNYNVMGYIVMNSSTVGEAIFKSIKFEGLAGKMGETEIHSLGDDGQMEVRWVCNQAHHSVKKHMVETILGSWVLYFRWLAKLDLSPIAVNFEHGQPESDSVLQIYEDIFRCPINFNCDFSSLIVDKKSLNLPIPHPNRDLLGTLETHAYSLLEQIGEPQIVAQVSSLIRKNLASGALKKEKVAFELGMNERTLQRRLSDEGTSYQVLLNDVRMAISADLLGKSMLSLQEIAGQSGYTDVRSFHYAFKKSMGLTPKSFRKTFKAEQISDK